MSPFFSLLVFAHLPRGTTPPEAGQKVKFKVHELSAAP